MAKLNNGKIKWIWLSVLILLVCVSATTVAFLSRLDSFLINDEGAIPLISNVASETHGTLSDAEDAQASDTTASKETETEIETQETDTSASTAVQITPSKNPGFEASDDNTVWSNNSQIEIFRISYENGRQIITVNSDNGHKVIAPGTENSYTFKLKNTGNVALDYTVEVDAYFAPADIEIPITARLNRYDGKWITGGKDEYGDIPALDKAEDQATLGSGRYTYYTLDWVWPFESGNDELDTQLGNLATDQDITFTVVINTTATESTDPGDNSGITPPQTGDNTNLALWITLAVSSFSMMIFLIICQIREKRRCNAEADKN